MPIKHQYLIVVALFGLVAVMVLLIAFDYVADKNRRFAIQVAGVRQNVGPGAAIYPRGMTNPGNGAAYCPTCRWQGICPRSGRCPNCRVQLFNPGGNYLANAPSLAAPAQAAAFFWPSTPQATVASPQPGVLACPGCNFRMACNARVGAGGIRCPRCVADLMPADVLEGRQRGFAYFNMPAASQMTQQAAFAPGWGNGQGNNPYCPLPAQAAVQTFVQGNGTGPGSVWAPGWGNGQGNNPYCPLPAQQAAFVQGNCVLPGQQMYVGNVNNTNQGNTPVFMLPPDPRMPQTGGAGYQQQPAGGLLSAWPR
jgi:hypothetical protein